MLYDLWLIYEELFKHLADFYKNIVNWLFFYTYKVFYDDNLDIYYDNFIIFIYNYFLLF